MRKGISKAAIKLLCLAMLFPTLVRGQNLELSDSGEKLDGIAALVNDGVVLLSELQDQTMLIVQRLRAEGTALPPQDILVQQDLESLAERDQEVLLLWDSGLSYREIAEVTSLSAGAVGTTLARARRRLVEAYGEMETDHAARN